MKSDNQTKFYFWSDMQQLAREFTKFHSLFPLLWGRVQPRLDKNNIIPTAAVAFSEKGDWIDFIINESFWAKLQMPQKAFIVAHEFCHVMLNHGPRTVELMKKYDRELINTALDLVVNHLLVRSFGFDRSEVDPEDVYCWVDKFWPPSEKVPDDANFEYYFNKLLDDKKNKKNYFKNGGSGLSVMWVNDHGNFVSLPKEKAEKILKRLAKQLGKTSVRELKKMLEKAASDGNRQGGQDAGKIAGDNFKLVPEFFQDPKHRWEEVIENWCRQSLRDRDIEREQWALPNRRLYGIHSDFCLPSDIDFEVRKLDKIKVWFFQDTSGSCSHLAERFFKAAESIPQDKFDVRLFCFDTQVYETDFKTRKLYGFGGTSFSCIEQYIQAEVGKNGLNSLVKNKNKDYPDAIFIVTDGYGDNVLPAFPKKWYWFLSCQYTQYIPKESQKFDLAQFE